MKKALSLLIALTLSSTPLVAIKGSEKNLLNSKPMRVVDTNSDMSLTHRSIFENRVAKREEVDRTKPKYKYQGEVLEGEYYKDRLVNTTSAFHLHNKENIPNLQEEDQELTSHNSTQDKKTLKPCLKQSSLETLETKELHEKLIAALNLEEEQESLIQENCIHCNPHKKNIHSSCEFIAKYLGNLNPIYDYDIALEQLLLVDTKSETQKDRAVYKAYITLPDNLKLPALMGVGQAQLESEEFRDTRICAREQKNKSVRNLTSVSMKFFIVSEYFWDLYESSDNS